MRQTAASAIVVGGGPAGLMAARVLAAAGVQVSLYDTMASLGRKFLLAGKGGLNLTHSEPLPDFIARYGTAAPQIAAWLQRFGPQSVREFARDLGIETFVGSSGRVFPADMKAGPMMRTWVRELREAGVSIRVRHRFCGWTEDAQLRFVTPEGEELHTRADITLLALGGGSWAKLGSDGAWMATFQREGIATAPLRPANCGFDCDWSEGFAKRYEGQPLKPISARLPNSDIWRRGEALITRNGIEGSLIYALAAPLRDALERDGKAVLELDLLPERRLADIQNALASPRGTRSRSEHWRRRLGLAGVKAGLLYECLPHEHWDDAAQLAHAIKALPITLHRTRPIDEAISTAGGVRFDAVDERLMLRNRPGTFIAGEMLDWEAPTGGYLLTACLASGVVAAEAALDWWQSQHGPLPHTASPALPQPPKANAPQAQIPCTPHAEGRCSSCALICQPHAEQLADKQAHAEHLLAPFGQIHWLPPLRSQASGFRNKAKMVVAGSIENPSLGILDAHGQGIDLADCPLYPPALSDCFPALRQFIRQARIAPYDVPTRRGELKYLLLTLAEHSGELMLRFVLRSQEPVARIRKHLPDLRSALPGLRVISVNLQPEHKAVLEGEEEIILSDSDTLSMRLNGMPLHLRPRSFFQTNTPIAAALYRQARDWMNSLNPPALWDLYCGVGGFALHCADGKRHVTGIELSADAIASACRSRDELQLDKLSFHAADATAHVQAAAQLPELIVVNPPRRGIGPALCQRLRHSEVRYIIYSSCNAESLARDIAQLHDFIPRQARLFDMFPHTHHYEVICLLERRSDSGNHD